MENTRPDRTVVPARSRTGCAISISSNEKYEVLETIQFNNNEKNVENYIVTMVIRSNHHHLKCDDYCLLLILWSIL